MGLRDPVILEFDDRYEKPWTLIRGRETFYDPETRSQRRWETRDQAVSWCEEILGFAPQDPDSETGFFCPRCGTVYQEGIMRCLTCNPDPESQRSQGRLWDLK